MFAQHRAQQNDKQQNDTLCNDSQHNDDTNVTHHNNIKLSSKNCSDSVDIQQLY